MYVYVYVCIYVYVYIYIYIYTSMVPSEKGSPYVYIYIYIYIYMHPEGTCNGVLTKVKWDEIIELEPSPIQMYVQDGELAGCYWTDRIKEHI